MIDFDRQNNVASYRGTTIPTPEEVQDTLSAFYFVRTLDLEPGTSHDLAVNSGGKNYRLRVDVLAREKIHTPFGERNAIKIEPHQQYEGLFQQKGRLWIWLSDDGNRLPLLMKSSLAIGSIVARLVEYRITTQPVRRSRRPHAGLAPQRGRPDVGH